VKEPEISLPSAEIKRHSQKRVGYIVGESVGAIVGCSVGSGVEVVGNLVGAGEGIIVG